MSSKAVVTMSKLSDGEIVTSSSGEYIKEKGVREDRPLRKHSSSGRHEKERSSRDKAYHDKYNSPPSRKRRHRTDSLDKEKSHKSLHKRSETRTHDSPDRYDRQKDSSRHRDRSSGRESHKKHSGSKRDKIKHSSKISNGKAISRKHRSHSNDSKTTADNSPTIADDILSDHLVDELLNQMNNSDDEQALLEKRREQRRKIVEKYSQPCQDVMSVSTNTNKCTSSNSFDINHADNSSNIHLVANSGDLSLLSQDGFVNNENVGQSKIDTTISTATKESVASSVVVDTQVNVSSDFLKKASTNAVSDASFDMFAEELKLECTNRASHFISKLETTKLMDSNDDAEGYYKVTIGELMNSRYSVYAMAGKGVFSNVMRARDITNNNQEVAIKMLRNNDLMKKQGLKELDILSKINSADPSGKHHCVQLFHHFKHRNHLCLVFEPLYVNMRELVKKYGNGIGLNIKAVRTYSYQIFQALKHLKKLSVIHADMKPDNIMVNYQKNQLKLCDFGSACFGDETEITPYLVSRFYRAPEIIFGLKYDCSIDLWSVGCTIFEMFTGRILFPARTNNEMLKLFMELKGKFSHKMIRKSTMRYSHFDDNYNFIYNDINPITQKERVTIISNIQATTDLGAMLTKNLNLDVPTKSKVMQLKDLLDKIFILDPSKRITVGQSIVHSFIVEKCL